MSEKASDRITSLQRNDTGETRSSTSSGGSSSTDIARRDFNKLPGNDKASGEKSGLSQYSVPEPMMGDTTADKKSPLPYGRSLRRTQDGPLTSDLTSQDLSAQPGNSHATRDATNQVTGSGGPTADTSLSFRKHMENLGNMSNPRESLMLRARYAQEAIYQAKDTSDSRNRNSVIGVPEQPRDAQMALADRIQALRENSGDPNSFQVRGESGENSEQ